MTGGLRHAAASLAPQIVLVNEQEGLRWLSSGPQLATSETFREFAHSAGNMRRSVHITHLLLLLAGDPTASCCQPGPAEMCKVPSHGAVAVMIVHASHQLAMLCIIQKRGWQTGGKHEPAFLSPEALHGLQDRFLSQEPSCLNMSGLFCNTDPSRPLPVHFRSTAIASRQPLGGCVVGLASIAKQCCHR